MRSLNMRELQKHKLVIFDIKRDCNRIIYTKQPRPVSVWHFGTLALRGPAVALNLTASNRPPSGFLPRF